MSSGCISSSTALGCVEARAAPVRVTYLNLYKWPESDAEFVKSVTRRGCSAACHQHQQPRVVDSYSCRQMYLRSYTFSKKQGLPERTRKCLGKVKQKVAAAVSGTKVPRCVPWGAGTGDGRRGAATGYTGGQGKGKRCLVVGKLREVSFAALSSVFHRLLSCTATIDVVGRH